MEADETLRLILYWEMQEEASIKALEYAVRQKNYLISKLGGISLDKPQLTLIQGGENG